MLKKLALDQTKTYEKHLALEEISNMLVCFVQGRPHNLAIGAEQGDVEKWDDLVIQTHNDSLIHVQAKRQTTDFSNDAIERDYYVKGPRKGFPRDLSPFDETIKSLGVATKFKKHLKKEFWIEIPEGSTEIKADLKIKDLRKLCERHIKSTTTADDLEKLAKIETSVEKIYKWLTTWCEFSNWNHILNAFKLLKIRTSGLESDIDARTKNNLRYIFKTSEIDRVFLLMDSYLDQNSTFAGAIMPRQLLFLLKEYLISNISKWTLFQTNGSKWEISGIHDLESNQEIERPAIIVPALWLDDNQIKRELKIEGACRETCLVSESLIRLSIHHKGSFDTYCSDKNSWENFIIKKTGGTLGITEKDFDDLRMLGGLETTLQSSTKKLTGFDEAENYAEELHKEMNKKTFQLVDCSILNKIRVMNKGALRTETENRWSAWKNSLENNEEIQGQLFSKILHPQAEGKSISGKLRVGVKTVDLLSEALFLLLVVSVCLGDGNNEKWETVANKLKMSSIGLAYWSGPATSSKQVIRIDDDDGMSKLLENEAAQILIIPQSTLSENDVFNDDISGELTKRGLLTHARYPKLLVTKDRNFTNKLKNGDILELKKYFQDYLDKDNSTIEEAINKVVDKVVI